MVSNIAKGFAAWLGVAMLSTTVEVGAAESVMSRQAQLLDAYQSSVSATEAGPLRLFHLLVSYANHELDTAQQVKDRIYKQDLPAELQTTLDRFQRQQRQAFDAAVAKLDEAGLERLKTRQQRELREYRDQLLMTLIKDEVKARDQQGQVLLDEMLAMVQPEPRLAKRILRKQRKLDTALRSLTDAYMTFDLSDHRLSTRVDRIKDFRLERLTLLLAMLSDPAERAIEDSVQQNKQLKSDYQALMAPQ